METIYMLRILPQTRRNKLAVLIYRSFNKQAQVFVGTNRESCLSQYVKHKFGVGRVTETNRYKIEVPVELTNITPTRIEGRMWFPKDPKIDCEKGQYAKPATEWLLFTWIPE